MTIQVIPATHKEVHLLSGPSELQLPDASEVYLLTRPLKTMAHRHRHTEKEAHLLSGPSELQPPDDSETQKFRSSTQVWQPRQEYNRFTETEKAKFQTPFTYNDERNFVRHNSVEKFSPHLVYLTKSDISSDSIFKKEGRKSQKTFLHLQKMYLHLHHLHLHPHWRQSENDHTLQEQGS